MSNLPSNLGRLARLYGVQPFYLDMRGERRDAEVESLLAVTRILGAEVDGIDDVESAIARREQELWDRSLEPVLLAWDGKLPPIRIRMRLSMKKTIHGGILLEDQTIDEIDLRPDKLPIRNKHQIGRTLYVEREWSIRRVFPAGYHYLHLHIGDLAVNTLIISAPTKAHFPFKRKQWGIFSPMYALHSERHPNSGTVAELDDLMEWMLQHKGRVAATLPLLAAFLDTPFEASPYSPASRLFWNEFYVDNGKAAKARRGDLVDYRREMQVRRRELEKQAVAFLKNRESLEYHQFQEFVHSSPNLAPYSRFRAVTEQQGAGWTSWPVRLQNGRISGRDYNPEVEQYHKYAQWRIQSQLRTLADKAKASDQVLYLDLPLGLHPDGYDIWAYRDLFVREATGGAPPDPVFTKGQNWGFPPMHPETSRLNHYDYTIAYIRTHLQKARLLRIDHVMGLHRLFWIPQGFSGDKGVYVSYPADEMYAILCLESHRNEAGIVGENLGTVPPEVNASMRRHNIQQMYVVQYELEGRDPQKALETVPKTCVASLNTHDMFPFAAFLNSTDIGDRLDLGFLPKADLKTEHARRSNMKKVLTEVLQDENLLPPGSRTNASVLFKSTVEHLAQSPANIVLLNIDDLLGETRPQNVPSTQKERPNWRRRTRLTLEQIKTSGKISVLLDSIERGRR
jgi:4-alpha-glucanotransferase